MPFSTFVSQTSPLAWSCMPLKLCDVERYVLEQKVHGGAIAMVTVGTLGTISMAVFAHSLVPRRLIHADGVGKTMRSDMERWKRFFIKTITRASRDEACKSDVAWLLGG